jgi:glutathione synthase/RimK-type ligase-like ATP-grasp enzyme
MENSKPNMRALVQASQNLNFTYRKIDPTGNFICINIDGKDFYFSISKVPINNESVAAICVNKAYTYWTLGEELPMPKTKAYLDPDSDDEVVSLNAEFKKQKLIVADILKNFQFPLIVKMNSGSKGKHVYKCDTKRKVAKAVKAVFNKKHKNYDSSILAQQFIEIKNEYRAILMDGELLLLYEKVAENKSTNLSPLHNEEGRAEIVHDENIRNQIIDIVNKSPTLKSFEWIGLDITKDSNGVWWVLELNTRPGFSYFIRDNGDTEIVKMYEKLLTRIKNGKN